MLERIALFVLGGSGYLGVELAWRGATHWTMFVAGGVCLCGLQMLAERPLPLAGAACAGAAGVSGVEAAVGVLCREVLHTAVWDYSAEWGQPGRARLPALHLLLVFAVRLGRVGAARRPAGHLQSGFLYCKDGARLKKPALWYRVCPILKAYHNRKAVPP